MNISNPITVNGSLVGSNPLATWTFESSQPATAGPFAAESGTNAATSNATGLHADGAAVYSSPAGNGSSHSFSSNTWGVGDYYQFTTSTLGQKGILLNFDQTSSNTGPRDFQVAYSTDGTIFTNVGSTYTVLPNGDPSPGFSSLTYHPDYTSAIDLSGITALNNQANDLYSLNRCVHGFCKWRHRCGRWHGPSRQRAVVAPWVRRFHRNLG